MTGEIVVVRKWRWLLTRRRWLSMYRLQRRERGPLRSAWLALAVLLAPTRVFLRGTRQNRALRERMRERREGLT